MTKCRLPHATKPLTTTRTVLYPAPYEAEPALARSRPTMHPGPSRAGQDRAVGGGALRSAAEVGRRQTVIRTTGTAAAARRRAQQPCRPTSAHRRRPRGPERRQRPREPALRGGGGRRSGADRAAPDGDALRTGAATAAPAGRETRRPPPAPHGQGHTAPVTDASRSFPQADTSAQHLSQACPTASHRQTQRHGGGQSGCHGGFTSHRGGHTTIRASQLAQQ